MVRRTKEAATLTRDAILDASERCFIEHGYRTASLEDVAEAAGVTRGAVYWHFKDKSALLLAVFMRVRVRMCDELSRLAGSGRSVQPARRLVRFCRAMAAEPDTERISVSAGAWMRHYEMFLAEPATRGLARELFWIIHETLSDVLYRDFGLRPHGRSKAAGLTAEVEALHLQALLIGLAQLRFTERFLPCKKVFSDQVIRQSIERLLDETEVVSLRRKRT
ncbi:TetR family transcriptional regulator [Burkholderia cepacia]|uniref:TetR family transcriptional regulator n=1 Tax=Burkholderia cepacia TaxID=292 RepID=UPI002AB73504|nr:TetR family transcriptional regulator [Burkholderia cepacia]